MGSESSSLKALKRHGRSEIEPADCLLIMEELIADSDRAAIIIAVSILEDSLGAGIRCYFMMPESSDALLSNGGPLSTFAAKIEMARQLGLVAEREANHLKVLKDIRNVCAHSMKPISLKDAILRDVVVMWFARTNHASQAAVADPARLKEILLGAIFNINFELLARSARADVERRSPVHGDQLWLEPAPQSGNS